MQRLGNAVSSRKIEEGTASVPGSTPTAVNKTASATRAAGPSGPGISARRAVQRCPSCDMQGPGARCAGYPVSFRPDRTPR